MFDPPGTHPSPIFETEVVGALGHIMLHVSFQRGMSFPNSRPPPGLAPDFLGLAPRVKTRLTPLAFLRRSNHMKQFWMLRRYLKQNSVNKDGSESRFLVRL